MSTVSSKCSGTNLGWGEKRSKVTASFSEAMRCRGTRLSMTLRTC